MTRTLVVHLETRFLSINADDEHSHKRIRLCADGSPLIPPDIMI